MTTQPRSRLLSAIVPYRREWLRADLIAGLTAGAVVIPQAMGYATVAGLPVEIGLYTCIFPLAAYALLGGSRRLSFSTTSTIVALTGLALARIGVAGDDALVAVATLTLMVGLSLILFRIIRMGWIIEAVSQATITGLKLAVGLTIIADQLPKLLGIPAAEGGFVDDVGNIFSSLGDTNGATVVVGGVTLGALFVVKRVLPKVPGPLIALVLGILLVLLTGLTDRGVATIPEVPTGLPMPAVPSLDHFMGLLPFALAIALMSYFETITAARIARRIDEPPLDSNQEYIAGGVASLIGSLFGTVPPAGGFSQTQVNTDAGAQTQLSGLLTAGLAVMVALVLAPLLADVPEAVLGAIVIVSVAALISVAEFRRLWNFDRAEFVIAVVTALLALLFDLLVGTVVGVILTFYLLIRSINHPVIVELRRQPATGEFLPARDGDEVVPGMLILRIEGDLYNMNIRGVQSTTYERIAALPVPPEVVLVDVSGTADTSITVADVVRETDFQLAKGGTELWVSGIPIKAEEKLVNAPHWAEYMAAGRIHATVATAVAAYEAADD